LTNFICVLCFLALPAAAQFETKILWTCPKEGRFTMTPCKDGVKQYCYDGRHFSVGQEGVPAWVKAYFDAEIARGAAEHGWPRVLNPSMQVVSVEA
jgi:hypothetical protein